MEGWKEGMEGQKDQRLEGREDVEEEWMLPQSLHKAHAVTSCNLLKKGTCLGALGCAGLLQGVSPWCPMLGNPPHHLSRPGSGK